jgi:hypothetical protein
VEMSVSFSGGHGLSFDRMAFVREADNPSPFATVGSMWIQIRAQTKIYLQL